MWGITQARTIDGLLDEISRLLTERDNALDELLALTKEHPELADDKHLNLACLALL